MKRILIVDDEKRIGILVQNLIHWKELDAECVGVFDKGREALAKIGETRVDIVITDVRMPGMDGLELIEEARKLNEDVHFIVISGYREFEYAHKALEFGVENYLLKPINEQELNAVLQKLKGKITRQDVQRETMEKSVEESNKIIKRDFLKNIIDQSDDRLVRHVDLKGDRYRGIDVKLDYTEYDNQNRRQDEITIDRVCRILQDSFRGQVEESLICEKEYHHIYCLLNYHAGNTANFLMVLNDCLLTIKEYIMGLDQYQVTIGVGSEKHNFEDIRFTILECHRAVCNRLKYGTGRLIFFEDVVVGEACNINQKVKEFQEELYAGIENFSMESVDTTLRRAIDSLSRDKMDMMEYYILAEKLIDISLSYLNLGVAEEVAYKKEIMGRIHHATSVFQIRKILCIGITNCMDQLKESREFQSVRPVRVAVDYVEKNYAGKITLEDVAKLVDLNPAYFSSLFKKEMDINFSNYLIKVRMDHAKKLLVETNETITAIAVAVGYENQKYFSQAFKKAVGVKPIMYRKMHS